MDEAARARAAARDAVDDITPAPLRDRIDARLRDATITPGVLTRLSARTTGVEGDPSGLDGRTAGVQLIYDGLRLTRKLIHTEPWVQDGGDKDAADNDALAANVMVARGAYLLARTEAADAAVEIIRAFGHDQTRQVDTGDSGFDRQLEADIVGLAVIAGGTITASEPPAPLLDWAEDLEASLQRAGFPAPAELVARAPAPVLASRK